MTNDQPPPQPRWSASGGLAAIDRRVAGVLVEKAKTTPDAYPMSINAICTGANQKNNRDPVMQLEPDDVEESLDRLRALGAVAVIEGSGRVSKYRHYLYDWLGVDKVELAVMAELLLRGPQTEGELRGRAARMEPIADLTALRPVLASLKAKGLVIPLTPEGRGHVVTHALYPPAELERLRSQRAGSAAPLAETPLSPQPATPIERTAAPLQPLPAAAAAPAVPRPVERPASIEVERIQAELRDLRGELGRLQQELSDLSGEFRNRMSDLDRLRQALG
ncbi:MAG: DUF480 domain-containing protein [Pirellulales bacterium]